MLSGKSFAAQHITKTLENKKPWLENVRALCKKKEDVPVLAHPRIHVEICLFFQRILEAANQFATNAFSAVAFPVGGRRLPEGAAYRSSRWR